MPTLYITASWLQAVTSGRTVSNANEAQVLAAILDIVILLAVRSFFADMYRPKHIGVLEKHGTLTRGCMTCPHIAGLNIRKYNLDGP